MRENFVQQRILENLNESILLFDHALILKYINTSGEILFADSARHLLGISAQRLFKASGTTVINDLQQSLKTGEALVDRGIEFHRFDKTVIINLSVTPLQDEQNKAELLVELQLLDRQVRISKEEQLLAQHNTAKMLVRGLAHEIKNPLGGLRGAAQLLEGELSDPELREYTQIIIAESDRLQGLMDKMLGPNILPNKAPLNIHEVLERVRQLVQVEVQDSIAFKRDFDPSIPLIKADKNQLIQAILNIVKNATQSLGKEGEIILRTRIRRQMTIGRVCYRLTVQVDIIDNGAGINPEIIEQIFYPMITGRAEGTGLGLSIAQSLIHQSHGIIECESEPGKTVFSIFIPLENEHET